jgi:predicted transcriptional regulator
MRTIMAENNSEGAPNFIELAGDITIAWLQNPMSIPLRGCSGLPQVHASAIAGLDERPQPSLCRSRCHEPAVSVRSSVKPDYLVSLIDGRKYKTETASCANGLTPDTYRARYGCELDYPMVAANFAALRRGIAEKIGLGRKSLARPDAAGEAIAVPAGQEAAYASDSGRP